MYNIKEIEAAFFNHDSDGSESNDNKEYEERRRQWASFKKYLNENTYEAKNGIPPLMSHYVCIKDKDEESK